MDHKNQITTGGFEVDDEYRFELAKTCFMILLFLLMCRERRLWLLLHTINGFFGALIIVVPSIYFRNQAGVLDNGFHACIIRMMGSFKFSLAVMFFLSEKSRDKTVQVSMSTAQIVGRLAALFLMLNQYFFLYNSVSSHERFEIRIILGLLLLVLYDAFTMPTLTRHEGQVQVGTHVYNHLLVEALALFLYSIAFLSYPQMILQLMILSEATNMYSEMIIRMIGCYSLMFALLLLFAMTFAENQDIKNVIRSKSVVHLITIASYLFWIYTHNQATTIEQFAVLPGIQLLFVANSWYIHERLLAGKKHV